MKGISTTRSIIIVAVFILVASIVILGASSPWVEKWECVEWECDYKLISSDTPWYNDNETCESILLTGSVVPGDKICTKQIKVRVRE